MLASGQMELLLHAACGLESFIDLNHQVIRFTHLHQPTLLAYDQSQQARYNGSWTQ